MNETNDYRTGRHVVTAMHVHLVFVTKYRRATLTQEMLDDLRSWFEVVCQPFEATLVEMNGENDHVHLLIEYPPKQAVSKMVNSLKGVSSRRFRQKYGHRLPAYFKYNALWSPSYFATSCGGAPLDMVKQYVQNR